MVCFRIVIFEYRYFDFRFPLRQRVIIYYVGSYFKVKGFRKQGASKFAVGVFYCKIVIFAAVIAQNLRGGFVCDKGAVAGPVVVGAVVDVLGAVGLQRAVQVDGGGPG